MNEEIQQEVNAFNTILKALPDAPEKGKRFWTDGDDQILCETEKDCNTIAYLLDAMGFCAVTGYYDPEEDVQNNWVDKFTGYYYVSA
jgi:hypothetical protein